MKITIKKNRYLTEQKRESAGQVEIDLKKVDQICIERFGDYLYIVRDNRRGYIDEKGRF